MPTRIWRRWVAPAGPDWMSSAAWHSATGFTLVEAMVVVAVVGIVSALGVSALLSARHRADALNGLRAVAPLFQLAKSASLGAGAAVVAQLRSSVGGTVTYLVFVDADNDFDPTNTTAGPEAGERVLASGELPVRARFAPAGAPYLGIPLPAPLQAIPANAPCTFCNPDSRLVTAVFRSGGTVALGGTPANHPIGASFTLEALGRDGAAAPPESVWTYVLVTRTGAMFTVDRK